MLAFLFVIANVCMWNTFFWFGGPALVVSSSPLQCGEADRPALSLGTQIENIFLRQVHDVATFAAWAITHSQYNTSYIKIHQVIIYIYTYTSTFHCVQASSLLCVFLRCLGQRKRQCAKKHAKTTSGETAANVECIVRRVIDAGCQSTQKGHGIWQCAKPKGSHSRGEGGKSQPRGREMAVRGCHICKFVVH